MVTMTTVQYIMGILYLHIANIDTDIDNHYVA